MHKDPYKPPETAVDSLHAGDHSATSHRHALWKAYLLAPLVPPVVFTVALLLVGAIAASTGSDINAASFLVLPALSLTLGVVVCYLLAAFIGMPIAFCLHHWGRLNGYTIHGLAVCFACVLSGIFISNFAMKPFTSSDYKLLLGLTIVVLVVPPVFLSGTAFWWIARRNGGLSPRIRK